MLKAGQWAALRVKSAIEKVLGVYDVQEDMVHIDETVSVEKRKRPLKATALPA
jgi:hypothetical protein